MKIEEILLAGGVPKELRKELKASISVSATHPKKRELLRNEWFEISKNMLANGGNAADILNGLEALLRLLDGHETEPTALESVKIGFSPSKDCKNLIIGHLMNAKKSLDICVFTISDNDIADCIIRRHQGGIKVRLIGDNEKAEDEGSDMMRMAEAGIPVKIDFTENHMHHKFSIADGKELLTGSYNWTRSAEQYNQENLLVWQNVGAAEIYQKEFDRLWEDLMHY